MQSRGTLGFMLQGVSQQAERVQPDGHVREQINWLDDPNGGKTTRPGTTLMHSYTNIPENAFISTIVLDNNLYLVACSEGSLKLYDYEGNEYSVSSTADDFDYISTNAAVYGADNEIVVVNKDMVVQGTNDETDDITQWGYALHLGGQFGKTYTLRMVYSDGPNDTISVSYTTPSGDSSGDAANTAAGAIMQNLLTSLVNHPNFRASSSASRADEVIQVQDSAGAFSLSAEDGAANTIMRAGVSRAETFADLPRFAPEGAIINVRAPMGFGSDSVWLRFDAQGFDTVGDGFGFQGTWRETVDPDQRFVFDLSTMPHIITLDTQAQEAVLNYGDWEGRRVGDSDLAPEPSFVGKTINDVGEFSSRLWFLAGNFFVASRTDKSLDFFRQTATTIIDSDPIDTTSTGEERSDLQFAISYDRNLLLFSRNGQFLITGGNALTPNNVVMVRSTNFESSNKTRPVLAGSTVLLPFRTQLFSGVNELRPSLELDSNAVDNTNKVTPRYIRGEINGLAASGNQNIALVRTDDDPSVLYVHKFLWEENTKVQASWSIWSFADSIRHIYMSEGTAYVLFEYGDQVHLNELRPDKPEDGNFLYHASMDYKRAVSVNSSIVTLDRPDYVFAVNEVGETGDYVPGMVITPKTVEQSGQEWVYTFDEVAAPELLAGVPFYASLSPNRPMHMDWRGHKQPAARVVVGKYVVDYEESGEIDAYMINAYRHEGEAFVLSNEAFPIDDNPLLGFDVPLRSGTFEIPWGEDNFNSALVIRTGTIQPVTLVEIRWWGQVLVGKR